jgi:archaellum biogenesis protein FlaJ (TadC family)
MDNYRLISLVIYIAILASIFEGVLYLKNVKLNPMLPNNETKNELKESYKGLFCWTMITICVILLLIAVVAPQLLKHYGITN